MSTPDERHRARELTLQSNLAASKRLTDHLADQVERGRPLPLLLAAINLAETLFLEIENIDDLVNQDRQLLREPGD